MEVRTMKPIGPVLIAFSLLGFPPIAAWADDASPPKATATRPAKEHPQETSLPNDKAPPATRTQETGSTDQSPVVKQMNAEEKKKLEIEGK
jgi:hypothetical protein